MKRMNLLLSMVLVAGCGGQVAVDDPRFIVGFKPTPPTGNQMQLVTPVLPTITAGQDVTFCSYLDFTADKTMDVTGYKGFQSQGGHHTILYATSKRQTPNTHVCDDNDMYNVHYIGGGGTDATISDQMIPAGIAFRIPKGAQVMMLSHWINATTKELPGQAAYNLSVQDPTSDVDPGDLFTVVTTNFTLPVGEGKAHTECVVKQDFKFFMIGGHAHEWATHITITHTPVTGEPKVIYDTPWTKELIFDTPLNSYTKAAPYVMRTGDKFSVDCSYSNTTTEPIAFPQEMCVGYGYYFPATAEIDCVDGFFPGPV